jgi:hypothetical protein
MDKESKTSFAIIRYNWRSYESGGVMEVVKGRENATLAIQRLDRAQSKEDWNLGWRYFAETTDLKPGTDPAKATQLRQVSMDLRESEG